MNQQSHNRKSDMYEIAYQKDAMIKTYQEEVKDEADTVDVDVPRAVANTSSGLDDPQNNYGTGQTGTTDNTEMLAMHESTCQKGMANKTYREEEKDEAHTEKVTVPGSVTNDDPQNNGVTGQMGAKDATKRLAVPTTASERGGGPMCMRSLTKRMCRTRPTQTIPTCLEPSPTLIPPAMVLKTNRTTAWQARRGPRTSPRGLP
jgi:hypothetical protein